MIHSSRLAAAVVAAVSLLFSVNSCSASVVQPGFQVALTSKGLEYVTNVGIPFLKEELSSISIPDQSGKADVKIGNIKYSLTNIHLADLSIGSSSLTTSPGVGLTFQATDISITVSADWKYKVLFISDHGSVKASASSISLGVSILAGATEKGQPNVTSTGCDFNVGHLSVKLNGGASWLYNLFDGIFEDNIKKLLDDKICELATNGINTGANKALGSLPVVIPIDEVSELSYALIGQPNFTSWFVLTDHKGEFMSVSQPNVKPPFSPSPLPSLPPSEQAQCRMVYLWATDYVANTAALVYMKAGLLRYNITPDMVSDLGPFFKLDTSTFSLVVPELYHRYPNKSISIGIRAAGDPPNIKIQPQGANITIFAAIDFYVIDKDSSPLAFTIGVVGSVDANVTLTDNAETNQLIVSANATKLRAKLNVVTTNVGHIDIAKFQGLFDAISNSVLLPQINKFAHQGFPIPNVEGLKFIKPSVSLAKGYVVISTDVSYS